MKQIRNFGDERQASQCAYCGQDTATRDHVPSRVLLDEPFPENLPVVPACRKCNEGFSADEEYVACLIECVISGTTLPEKVQRDKIQLILKSKPALTARLEEARKERRGIVTFSIEDIRLKNLVMKLGRGHALFELNEPHNEEPTSIEYVPIALLSSDARARFDQLQASAIWPEIGSRAMQRLAVGCTNTPEWIVVQPGRYRYVAFVDDVVVVRIVLSEYLACEVIW